jgi:hypothetical protein
LSLSVKTGYYPNEKYLSGTSGNNFRIGPKLKLANMLKK